MHSARIFRVLAGSFALATAAAACGASNAEQPNGTEPRGQGTNVEVAELEVSADGLDRFRACPPPGELGQGWIPPVPPWSAPPVTQPKDRPQEPPEALPQRPDDGRTETERAIADTFRAFRGCYRQGLVHASSQDGHAAIVLRVGGDGRVAYVEHYGACDLSTEVLGCLRQSAGKLRFNPPAKGSDTITIPATFTRKDGRMEHEHPSPNASYTAAAFITIEGARADLHACEGNARSQGKPVEASASFALDLDGQGRVLHTHVDNFLGDQELLVCAAHVFEKLVFLPPPGGKGNILARLVFNPRLR